ncbi:MAG TPA: condensation domain-containing protein, partial [Herpetosiphonaceae bacterium]
LADYQSRDLDLGPGRRVLQFASLSFDASISEVAMALTTGATLVLAHEDARLPGRELQTLLRDQAINVVTLPPAALAATPADDLPALKTVLAAGEACPAAVVARWAPGRRFVNAYGPSEASVCATFALCVAADQPPPIGRPLANVEVLVLDAALEPVPIGVAGELYIGGVGLARGYRGRPDLTAERFLPHPFSRTPGARLYRTGDLVRWRPDGNLEFLGRQDHQVKLRGFRIELGEIEATLRQHPAVQQAAVLVREYPSASGDYPDMRLVAYVVGENLEPRTKNLTEEPRTQNLEPNGEQRTENKEQKSPTDSPSPAAQEREGEPATAGQGEGRRSGGEGLSSTFRRHLAERLPSYMVPSAVVIMDQLPSTTSGKLDRRALPLPNLGKTEASNYVAPRDSVETTLAQIWHDVLGVERAGVHDNFFELGGHSLLVMQVIARIRDTFAVDLPPRSLFETPTIAGIAVTIEQALTHEQPFHLPPITRIGHQKQPPLSFAQERLWITEQLNPGRSAYTMPAALRLDGPLNVAALNRSLQAVVARHEALRTAFRVSDGQVFQAVAPELTIPLLVDDLRAEPPLTEAEIQARITAEAAQPFDLQHGPLLRLRLLRLHPTEHILVLSLHHLIADGWSISVLVRELEQLYAAACAAVDLTLDDLSALLPPLPVQYADYALWERRHLSAAWLEPHRVYWQQLADAPTVLELPTDRPRPAVQTFNGAHLPLEFSPALSAAIVELSQREGVTVFMTLCTALATVLSRYTRQADILIGTPAAHRTHPETEELIGLFINTLALRCDLTGAPTVAQALQRMRTTCLEAYAHQELPFAQVIELIQPERDPSRSPLVQVLMAWQNTPTMIADLADVAVTTLPVESGTAQFDLTFNLGETAGGISGTIEYNTDLFAAATIARLAGHFQQLLQAMIADPAQRLSRLPLLTDAEQRQLLVDWNAATLEAPAVDGIHELVQAQVERTPTAIAVVAGDRSITYADLNTRANRLAHYLRQQGIGTDAATEVCVGVAMEPSIEMVVGLLAILKAGAAYVPLDPDYPAERFHALLGHREIALLLTQPHLLPALPSVDVPILSLDPQPDQLAAWPSTDPTAGRS